MNGPYSLGTSCHGMACIELANGPERACQLLKRIIEQRHIDHPDYRIRKKAGAFLQGYAPPWVLVEFWAPIGHQEFVDYANTAYLAAEEKPL